MSETAILPKEPSFHIHCGKSGKECKCIKWCISCNKPKDECLGTGACMSWCTHCANPKSKCKCPKVPVIGVMSQHRRNQ